MKALGVSEERLESVACDLADAHRGQQLTSPNWWEVWDFAGADLGTIIGAANQLDRVY